MEILFFLGGGLLGVALTLVLVLAWGRQRIQSLGFVRRLLGREETAPKTLAESDAARPFRALEAAEGLLGSEGEIRALYERLGFSLGLEQRAQALIEEIKASVVVEIPDFEAFQQAIRGSLPASEGAGEEGALEEAKRSRASDPLLRAVLSAPNEGAVLEALRRAPVDEVLPFVEEVPLLRGGTVVWRTPMGLDVLHKRAENPSKLLRLLEELVQRVKSTTLRREPKAKTELLKAIAALSRAIEEGQPYLVNPIKAVERKLADWYLAPEDSAARERRRSLDQLLLDLVTLRQEVSSAPLERSFGGPLDALNKRLVALVQRYVVASALHTPRLSQLLLEPLLMVESLVRASPGPVSRRGPAEVPQLLLHSIAQEVRSGHFDSEETIRRLRSLEAHGLFVHSLIYRLLKMAAA